MTFLEVAYDASAHFPVKKEVTEYVSVDLSMKVAFHIGHSNKHYNT